MSLYSPHRSFSLMADTLERGLDSSSPSADAPPNSMKVSLRAHQQAVLAAMEKSEQELISGMECAGETLYSSYGILGDSVGVGKSLMVLAHIARLSTLSPLPQMKTLGANSSNKMFSIKSEETLDMSGAGCLIVVPHTLFRQWSDYIKKQTQLTHFLIDKKKNLLQDTFRQSVMDAQVVLISNTQYKEFSIWQRENRILWKRMFVDEADTIHIVNGYPKPEAEFTWFITASWMNMLFPNETLYIQQLTLLANVFNEGAPYSCLKPYFSELMRSGRPYNYMRFSMTSYNFFRDVLNNSHRLRGRLVIKCADAFVQESISLPVLYRSNVICVAPIHQQIVADAVPADVQQLLHGGDVAGAIAALGVKSEDTTSLIDAVTINLKKELQRLKATYDFKAGLDYSTAQSKEAALKSLEDKIKGKEEAIKSIQQRIEGFSSEVCPICYDPPSEPMVTPCCSRVFCAQCILSCRTRSAACPMCRTEYRIGQLKKIVLEKQETEIVEEAPSEGPKEKKADALLRLFKENPTGKFLVFSRYDNPFTAMEEAITGLGVTVKQLKGNKDGIASTLRQFQGGDVRCLLLNSHYAGSGLNITAATHVILLHAMTHEEEKQILGRAYRMGRTEPLHFIKLLHQDEMPTTN
jgi:SNF2 family DNA or RNA helicase